MARATERARIIATGRRSAGPVDGRLSADGASVVAMTGVSTTGLGVVETEEFSSFETGAVFSVEGSRSS